MTEPVVLTLDLRLEQDVVLARQRARQVAALLEFSPQDQTRIGTAVSEIARNAHEYARGGRVRFLLRTQGVPALVVEVKDQGPGIAGLEEILAGQYQSRTGMGLGIVGARRLMDDFEIESAPGKGTTVRMSKALPRQRTPVTSRTAGQIANSLASTAPESPFEELQLQNQELIRTLDEVSRLNQELEDTNRGVVALYAELDEHAGYLQRANELKSQFLSNMSHEFRTPLNAINSLSRLLIEEDLGPLLPEQAKTVALIRKSSQDLTELVNDLLDLAKVEAGKVTVRPVEFHTEDLLASLRGMLRPLVDPNRSLSLVFEPPDPDILLYTDESKLNQILRNFISNALKFTLEGTISVSAREAEGDLVQFTVADTGIGIPLEEQERVFDEFAQVEGPHQRGLRGTGLGLPLCRRLAELLGGSISLESAPGAGSTFTLTLPRRYGGASEVFLPPGPPAQAGEVDPQRLPVLVIENNPETLFLVENYLAGSRYQVIAARTAREGRRAIQSVRPVAIVLDVLLDRDNCWEFLEEIKAMPRTADIPVLVISTVDFEPRAKRSGADLFRLKPIDPAWLLDCLNGLVRRGAEAAAVPQRKT
jgi:signal transduction histidine kinase/CheY-like chemotaxis protein